MPDTPKIIKNNKIDTVTIHGIVVTNGLKANDTLVTVSGTIVPAKAWYQEDGFKFTVPLIFTLLLFFLGQFFTILWKKKDRRSLLVNSKTSLETWVMQLQPSIQTMLNNCIKFSESLKNEQHVQRVTLEFTPTLITKISELNINDVQAFTIFNLIGDRIENEKKAYTITQNIEIIKGYENEILKQYEKFTKDVDGLMDDLNDAQDQVNNSVVKMLTEVASIGGHTAYDFSHKVNDLINKFNHDHKEDKTVKIINDEYINPLFAIFENEMQNNPKNTYIAILTPSVIKLAITLKKWETYQNGYSKVIAEFGVNYVNAYNNLSSDIQKLQKQKLVSAWHIK